jgi:hypothetical protein
MKANKTSYFVDDLGTFFESPLSINNDEQRALIGISRMVIKLILIRIIC